MRMICQLGLCSTSLRGLDGAPDRLATYAERWGLEVSLSKTKVMVFEAGRGLAQRVHVACGGQQIS